MNEHPLRKTLRHLAEEPFPPGTDLWPEIHQQLEGDKPYQRNEMNNRFLNFTRTLAFGAVLILLALGLAWMLSNTSPQPAIVDTQTTQSTNTPLRATDIPTTSLPDKVPDSILNYETYRNRGIDKILVGDLDGGLLDLAQAKEFQTLDEEAQNYSEWATAYKLGMSFMDVDWEQAVYYFQQVALEAPDLHDSLGITATSRFEVALEKHIAQLINDEDWCQALTYHRRLGVFNPSKQGEAAFQNTGLELSEQCPSLTAPLISRESDSDTIRQILEYSKLNWRSIWVDAVTTRIDGDSTYVTRTQIWFVDPDKSREIYDFDNDNLADEMIFTQNVLRTTFDFTSKAETTQVLSNLPQPPLPILNPGNMFKTGMQSNGGTFYPIEYSIIANRETLVVEWIDSDGQAKDRIWVDVYTGIILKWKNLREGYKGLIDGQEYLMPAEIEVLDITYDGMFSEAMFNPYVPAEPIYMDYSEISVTAPEGNRDLAALQAQVDFPLLMPSVLPENYTFSGWHYKPNETPVALEFDCGRGTADWWAFVIQVMPNSVEADIRTQLLRSFIGQGGELEKVFIGDLEGEYLQGDWVEKFDPVTLKTTGKDWNPNLNIHHLVWHRNNIVYWVHITRAGIDPAYTGPCRLDKEDLLAFANSLE